jgi:hypothetical protein
MPDKEELKKRVQSAIDGFYKHNMKKVERKKKFWKEAGRPKWIKEWLARKANEKGD